MTTDDVRGLFQQATPRLPSTVQYPRDNPRWGDPRRKPGELLEKILYGPNPFLEPLPPPPLFQFPRVPCYPPPPDWMSAAFCDWLETNAADLIASGFISSWWRDPYADVRREIQHWLDHYSPAEAYPAPKPFPPIDGAYWSSPNVYYREEPPC